jgi:hypothetical protein
MTTLTAASEPDPIPFVHFPGGTVTSATFQLCPVPDPGGVVQVLGEGAALYLMGTADQLRKLADKLRDHAAWMDRRLAEAAAPTTQKEAA